MWHTVRHICRINLPWSFFSRTKDQNLARHYIFWLSPQHLHPNPFPLCLPYSKIHLLTLHWNHQYPCESLLHYLMTDLEWLNCLTETFILLHLLFTHFVHLLLSIELQPLPIAHTAQGHLLKVIKNKFYIWINRTLACNNWGTDIRGLTTGLATFLQGSQEPLVITRLEDPRWVWSEQVRGILLLENILASEKLSLCCFSLQCSDTVGWVTGRASSLKNAGCWWQFDWSFAHLIAATFTITSTIVSSNEIQAGCSTLLLYHI